ncbi:RagB/SusD family nutrient uptake outer membrane protein [Tenacibaculum maritimum]|uniref:SusD/RagB family lipoprotein n=1 Tax=Tenacibaculum maritimum NCIMB 2154 TaxID=1349785 RepID=A0A2H1EBI1_9FLAO|nr:RagB/SusD family nutrient uptake outer membrane protein [Tenacibaculum maritimum]SFZ83940.1 SusD/RagB family lipoprotein precursor [Tenacibaculum maritimum NCIMB 2154]
MNKILLTLGITVGVLSLSSCEDQLTNTPHNSLTPSSLFSTPNGFSNAIKGVYSGMIGNDRDASKDYYGGDYYSVPDILSDNLIINQKGRQSKRTLYDWLYNSNSYSGFDLYADAYKAINRCNRVIENINNLAEGAFKNNIEGEALAIRALAHFNLVRTYAQIPTQSTNAGESLGVPYVTSSAPLLKPVRNTVNEVYANIVSDLIASDNLIATSNGTGRFNKNTVASILSRVYLYMGEWQNAINAANKVAGNVASITNFPKVWKDESFEGVISQFLIRNIDQIAIGTEYSQTSATSGVRSEYVISYDFYQKYKSNDIRKDSYISTSPFAGTNYNHIAKYFGKSGQTNNIVNAKVIRMAEVMLNKAEALSELPGQDAAALIALDAVRSKRYTNFVSGGETGQALKDAIALERRLELAFEGHRFYDIKRKGGAINRHTTFGDLADGTGVAPVFKTLKAGDHKFQLPIPQDAMNANPNLVQNPGY